MFNRISLFQSFSLSLSPSLSLSRSCTYGQRRSIRTNEWETDNKRSTERPRLSTNYVLRTLTQSHVLYVRRPYFFWEGENLLHTYVKFYFDWRFRPFLRHWPQQLSFFFIGMYINPANLCIWHTHIHTHTHTHAHREKVYTLIESIQREKER